MPQVALLMCWVLKHLPACGVLVVAGVWNADATELVPGNIQGWQNPYVEPANDRARCEVSKRAWVECAREEQDHSTNFLQVLVGKVLDKMVPERRPLFRKSQQHWQSFRDASCRFEAEGHDKSRANLEKAICAHIYNQSRIELLSKYHHCLSTDHCSSNFSLYMIIHWQLHPVTVESVPNKKRQE